MNGTPQNLDWVFALIGIALGGMGVLVIALALFRDKARGSRRCPKCWYDMSGAATLQCPECGSVARTERDLYRPRRRWKRAGFGAALLTLALIVAAVPSYQRGWPSLLPGWLLVYVAPAQGRPPGTRMVLPAVMLGSKSVPPSVASAIASAMATPSSLTAPQRLTAEVWDRLNTNQLYLWEERAFIARCMRRRGLTIRNLVAVPERWPAGEGIPVQISDLGPGISSAYLVTAQIDGASDATQPAWIDPGRVATQSIQAHVELNSRAGTMIEQADLTFPCRIVPSGEDLLVPDASEETNQRMRAALRPYIAWDQTGKATIIAGDRSSHAPWIDINMAIRFQIDITLDGRTLATAAGHVEWRPVWKNWQELDPQWTPGAAELAAANRDRLRLIVRAVHNNGADDDFLSSPFTRSPRQWSGAFEVPAALGAQDNPPTGAPR